MEVDTFNFEHHLVVNQATPILSAVTERDARTREVDVKILLFVKNLVQYGELVLQKKKRDHL